MRRLQIDTAENRERIAKRVANVYPGCTVEFVPPGRSSRLSFRIKDHKGRYRSGVIHIYRISSDTFTRRWLQREIARASVAGETGYPRLLQDA